MKKMKPKVKGMTFKNIMQIGLSSTIIVVLLMFAVMYYSYTSKIVNENIQLSLRNFAVSAQYILSGDDHERVVSSDSDIFKDQVKILADYKEEVGIYDVYTIIKSGESETQLVLAAYDAESTFHQTYIYTETMREAFDGNVSVTSKPYRDDFGTFYSGYAPLFNSSGQQVAIVAVDINNKEIEALKREVIMTTLILFGLSLLISNIMVYILSKYLSKYFDNIIISLKKIGEGDFSGVKTEPNMIIEMNDLGDTISDMAKRINRLMSIINVNALELEEKAMHIMKLVTTTNTSSQIISSAVEQMSDVHEHTSKFLSESLDELITKDKDANKKIESYRDLLESVDNTKDNLKEIILSLKGIELNVSEADPKNSEEDMRKRNNIEMLVENLYKNYDAFSENVTAQMMDLDNTVIRLDMLIDFDQKITTNLKSISQGNYLILETMEHQSNAIQGITKEVTSLEEMAAELSNNLKQIKTR